MTVEAAITDLQAKLLALSGMKAAPATPPEAIGAFPFAVTYERTGALSSHSSIFGDELVTLCSEIHVARGNLSTAIIQAMTFRDPFIKAVVADPSLSSSVQGFRDMRWTFGSLVWNGIDTLGYRFEIDVEVQVSI